MVMHAGRCFVERTQIVCMNEGAVRVSHVAVVGPALITLEHGMARASRAGSGAGRARENMYIYRDIVCTAFRKFILASCSPSDTPSRPGSYSRALKQPRAILSPDAPFETDDASAFYGFAIL